MRKIWKWILGIVLALLVVGALVAAGFYWRSSALGAGDQSASRPGWSMGPLMHRNYQGFPNSPMMRRDGYGRTLERGRLFAPLGFLFPLVGLLRLAILGLLLYAAYWLGRRNARVVVDRPTAAPQGPAEPAHDRTPPAAS